MANGRRNSVATVEGRRAGAGARARVARRAGYLLAAVVVVGYLVPLAVSSVLSNSVGSSRSRSGSAPRSRAVAGLVWLAFQFVGTNPPRGFRGGVFLTLVCAFLTFGLAQVVGIGMNANGTVGLLVTAAVSPASCSVRTSSSPAAAAGGG